MTESEICELQNRWALRVETGGANGSPAMQMPVTPWTASNNKHETSCPENNE